MRYARVINNVVHEIILPHNKPDGNEYLIGEMFDGDMLAEMVDITNLDAAIDQHWSYDGQDFTAPLPHTISWSEIRAKRNAKLGNSDWTQSSDSPLASEAKTEWATYRQELRDLPSTNPDPNAVVWPNIPEDE